MTVERELFRLGNAAVLGIDEVGRGALAGPVAVGVVAVGRAPGPMPEGLRDSKLLSAARRALLAPACAAWAGLHGVGMATAAEIDRLGIV
ncbi:MAG TPA: ribonuclease HII, partial [Microbacteriaceae bacterium]|nr:ribonuclease HII [Microbacteriaceae bacterium]